MRRLTIILVIAACFTGSSNAQQESSLLHLLTKQSKDAIEDNGIAFVPENNPAVSEMASCDNRECDQRCRRLGFTGGVCVNGNCKCDINFSAKNLDMDVENRIKSLNTPAVSEFASCDNRECDQRCRRLGFTGGVCVNGNCKCDINFSAKNLDVDVESRIESFNRPAISEFASCDNRECDQRCRRLGFTGGVCVNGNCKCDINFSAKNLDVDVENRIKSLNTPAISEFASCDNRECDQRCRRLGFTGGVCVNGNCKCDINFSAKNLDVDVENRIESFNRPAVSEFASCDNRECDQRCRRIGFTGGVCVNGKCKCDINFSAKNQDVDVENRIQSLNTPAISEFASCNNRECYQRCRRLGFTGGVCVKGRCKCDIVSEKNQYDIEPQVVFVV